MKKFIYNKSALELTVKIVSEYNQNFTAEQIREYILRDIKEVKARLPLKPNYVINTCGYIIRAHHWNQMDDDEWEISIDIDAGVLAIPNHEEIEV